MDKIEEVLTRGVENIIPSREKLREVLTSGKKLNIYLGIDPTSTQIHLGHAVSLRKLQALADLGHNVTFLIGDFTALVGDTSDKESERPSLTAEEINKNFQTYKTQAAKILDFTKIKIRFNSEWLKELNFADVIKLCQHFSAGDFFNRELIKKRLSEGKHVGLHEVLYPVMQAYDSYHMDTDIQLGGTDQTYNMQAGRILMKDLRNKDSFIIATSFLTGTDDRKMSKTWNNAIWLEDHPEEVFGKVMSLHDELIIQYFTLGTNATTEEIEKVKSRLAVGENPMQLKKELAQRMVSELHSQKDADRAQQEFETRFQAKNLSAATLPTFSSSTFNSTATIIDVLVQVGLADSRSVAKRLIDQKAVSVNDEAIADAKTPFQSASGTIIKAGRKAVKII